MTIYRLIITILFIELLTIKIGFTKVDPPNYDFSVNKFDIFMPGSKLSDIEKVYKKKELVFKEDPFTTFKFYIEHIRYKFAILVQFNNGIVTDFHARLPQYFLHNIFHQSLITKLGPQDVYKKVDEHAVYIWKNKKNIKHIYSGACTITCFPIHYSAKKLGNELTGEFKSIIEKLESKTN